MDLPTRGGAGGEGRVKNKAEIYRTGWRGTSFSRDKRSFSAMGVVLYYMEGMEGGP